MTASLSVPGIYPDEIFLQPPLRLASGVPGFAGFAERIGGGTGPQALHHQADFAKRFAAPADGFLAEAVAGFFRNGGVCCHVAAADSALDPEKALRRAVESLAVVDDVDLVSVPDAMTLRRSEAKRPDGAYADLSVGAIDALQRWLLGHCAALGDRFAILDALPAHAGGPAASLADRASLPADAAMSGAMYGPWLRVPREDGSTRLQPPGGHVAGVYARSDAKTGVFKAPANETLQGVVDLESQAGPASGVNLLRAFPGRGLRVWGARTLSAETHWRYVSVRRLVIMLRRWIDRRMPWATFEPNGPALWQRIERELGAMLEDLWHRGALQGKAPREAFFVRCNGETNAGRRDGTVTEIGLAPTVPAEFVVVRIVHRVAEAEDDPLV